MKTKDLQNELSLSLFPLTDKDIETGFKGKHLFKNYMYCGDNIKYTIKRIFIDCLENNIKTICIHLNTPDVKNQDEKIKLERFVNTVLLFVHKYRLVYNVNVKLLRKNKLI